MLLQRVDFIHHQIKQLNNDLSDLVKALETLNQEEKAEFYKKLLPESNCLVQSINLLTK
ncbi:hypothetical protein ACQKP0_21515 [Heyndrickxia sp. NPDC080065]|uniref:hypothetical protein n=1 Tax=Heyndrickxia sp. NPDC080065 TaxID=3390568 RepID=UPI003CFEC84D